MSSVLANAGLVLLFILIGGFFAAAEIALVSLRESQVRTLSQCGRRGSRVARLTSDPNRFLSAVQIGVTFAGFLASAFGATTIAPDLAPIFEGWGLAAGIARPVALVVMTLVIAFCSLVLGELAPKRIALQRAEGLSLLVGPVIDLVATIFRPFIWLLSVSTNLVVRVVGGDPRASRETITEEELHDLVARHASLGEDERELIGQVFAAGRRQVREVLVPRTEVEFIDAEMTVDQAAKVAADSPHSRYPVFRGSHDNVVGFVHVRDLFDPSLDGGRSARVGEVARAVKMLPSSKQLLPALSEMRGEGYHLAIVVDEYGGTAGIVTLEDLVEELVGDIRDEYDIDQAHARRLRNGVVEVEGLLNLDDFAGETGLRLPEGPYETVAGYVVAALGHLPRVGESVEAVGHRFTVSELDGRRVARVRVIPILISGEEAEPARGS